MFKRLAIMVGLVVLASAWVATAQQSQPQEGSHLVWEATSSGALAQRDPGNLVAQGLARHNAFQANTFFPPEITQTAEEPKLITLLKVQAIQAIFDNLNAVLLVLDNAIRAQAGFPPYMPSPITPAGGGGLPGLGSLDISSVLGER